MDKCELLIVGNENNKERMKKTEIAKILEWHNSGTLKTEEAVERICSLFSVSKKEVEEQKQIAYDKGCYDGYKDCKNSF